MILETPYIYNIGGVTSLEGVSTMPRRRTQKQNRVHKDAAVRPCKKKNKSTTHHLPGFWDELSSISTIFVTRRALKELDRRNTLLSAGYLGRQSTSNSFAGDIKRFARHGGPDLLDLRAVCRLPISYLPTTGSANP